MNQSILGRRPLAAGALAMLSVAAVACSSSSDSSSEPTAAPATTSDAESAPAATGAATDTVAATEPAAAAPAGDGACANVPSEEQVESVIGAVVLPGEDQGSLGCAYIGDGNNVGVYFAITTDEFDLANFDAPDPQFATLVDDPNLPAGSFVQSGDFFAKKSGTLYKVVASVNGTEEDDPLATQLMIAWLALVP